MAKKRKAGRPTKYEGLDSRIVGKLVEAFKDDFTVEEACFHAGIHKSTFYDWMEEYEEFSDEIERSKMHVLVEAKKKLKKAVLESDNINLLMKFLERRQPTQYSMQQDKFKVFEQNQALTRNVGLSSMFS